MADKSYKLTLSLSDGSTINAGTITAPQGPNGANGVTFTPSVSAAGVLSWTNNGGLTNPSPISIKGPKGDDAVITESDVKGWGFTKNEGTITEIKMNGASKGKSGVVDLGTVFTAHTGLVGGNLVQYDSTAQTLKDSGKKISDLATSVKVNGNTIASSGGVIDIGTVLTDASKFATSAQGTKADNAVPNTRKVNNKALSSDITLGAADVGVTETAFPGLKKTGTVTGVKMNETTKNPSSGVVDLGTVLTDASKFATAAQGTKADNALSLDGGTIKKSKTIKMDASANSDGANLKWGTVNHKNPYIGYASDQSDGTFVIGSLLGTNYASGLAICGGSGNLLWKGTKVATISDIPNIVQSTGTSTSSVMSQNATTNAISGKLDKTTYEVNKTITFGSSGVLYVGKFKVYDTNVTCEVTSTTDVTYSGKLVIATQNYVIKQMTVYGDAANTVAPNFFIKPSTTSDPYIEVYFKPSSWSKNVVHIYGSEIKAEPTNVCTNVPSVPSTATSKPTNALNSKANLSDLPTYSLSGTTLTITL